MVLEGCCTECRIVRTTAAHYWRRSLHCRYSTRASDLDFSIRPGADARRGRAAGRLLYVVNDGSFFSSHRLPVALAARDAGFEVTIAAPETPEATAWRDLGLAHAVVPFRRGSQNPFRDVASVTALLRTLAAVQPDLIHNVTLKPILYGSYAARLRRIPAVVNAVSGLGYLFIRRGTVAETKRAVIGWAWREAFRHPNSWAIVQNPSDRALIEDTADVPSARVRLIPGSGVDVRAFTPTSEPAETAVLLPARMLGDKGVREFVGAARILRASRPRTRFVLAGGLDPANPTAIPFAEIERWQAEGAVEWLGHVSDMAPLFATATLVVLPSYREGLPKSLIEAAAAGRPIVTTDVPGCRDVVRDGVNGRLVPPRETDSLARAISELLDDAAVRLTMGERGRARAVTEFALDRVVKATLEVYDDAARACA